MVLQNSQCQVGAVTAAASGLSQILTVAITFKGAFSGTKNIYMYGSDAGLNTGWVLRGTYLVAAGGLAGGKFGGAGRGIGSGAALQLHGFRSRRLRLPHRRGDAAVLNAQHRQRVQHGLRPHAQRGVARLRQSRQWRDSRNARIEHRRRPTRSARLNGANTTVVIGVTSIVVTVDLTFNANWFGAKNVYLLASETIVNSGWVTVGGWTVTGGAPTADSVVARVGIRHAPPTSRSP